MLLKLFAVAVLMRVMKWRSQKLDRAVTKCKNKKSQIIGVLSVLVSRNQIKIDLYNVIYAKQKSTKTAMDMS